MDVLSLGVLNLGTQKAIFTVMNLIAAIFIQRQSFLGSINMGDKNRMGLQRTGSWGSLGCHLNFIFGIFHIGISLSELKPAKNSPILP